MSYKINVMRNTDVPDFQKVSELISDCAMLALEQEGAPENSAVDITIVDNDEIRQINAEYRDKDMVTDVLSFPMLNFYNGKATEDVDLERNPEDNVLFLGDMILNYNRACEQAKEYGHSVQRECGFLTVHSIMHLLGYDHERSEEERVLQRQHEEQAMSRLGLVRE